MYSCDKSDYDEKIMAHLQHDTTYEKLRKNPTAVVGMQRARGTYGRKEICRRRAIIKCINLQRSPQVFMASRRYIKMERFSDQS